MLELPLTGPDTGADPESSMNYATFIIHGARGSHPAVGPGFRTYGGHTSCFSIETESELILLDAGSGITRLNEVCTAWPSPKPISIFLTHYHLDHITGLAGFRPIYSPGYRIQFYGGPSAPGLSCQSALERFFQRPFWPVPMADMGSDVLYHDLDLDQPSLHIGGLEIRWFPVPHTEPCLAYQVRSRRGSITLSTDHETTPDTEEAFTDFARGTDILIQDAQYTPAEIESRRGWGHCTWEDAARIATRANAKRLLLTHHDPDHTDADLDAILEQTRRQFKNTRLATTGMAFSFASAEAAPETAAAV
jgi:phosphoribosyl 1,2-cyclic phosphodiesterase